jgi:hypothetical protein
MQQCHYFSDEDPITDLAKAKDFPGVIYDLLHYVKFVAIL